jgi:hypothetical protein
MVAAVANTRRGNKSSEGSSSSSSGGVAGSAPALAGGKSELSKLVDGYVY